MYQQSCTQKKPLAHWGNDDNNNETKVRKKETYLHKKDSKLLMN